MWRNIVLETPLFWATINFQGPLTAQISPIRRAKELPLSIYCHLSGITLNDAFWSAAHDLVSQSERFQEVLLTFDPNDRSEAARLLQIADAGHAPHLRILCVKMDPSYGFAAELSNPWISMPSLSCLELKDVIFLAQTLPDLPSLRVLIVEGAASQYSVPASWLINVLQKTPKLEEVHLSQVSSDELSACHVYLPHLRHFEFQSKDLAACKVLELLSFPNAITVMVKCVSDTSLPETWDLSSLEYFLSRFTSGPNARPCDRLVLFTADSLKYNVSPLTFRLEASSLDGQPLSLTIELPFVAPEMPRFTRLVRCLPLESITNLTFSNTCLSTTSQVWMELLPALKSVTVLKIDHHEDAGLAQALTQSHEGDISLPSLEVLSYELMSFNTISALEEPTDEGLPLDQLDRLVDETINDDPDLFRVGLVKRRRDMGSPFRKIVLEDCDITQNHVDIFKSDVPEDDVPSPSPQPPDLKTNDLSIQAQRDHAGV
ncbi:hypothetical protein ONZ45_g10916 [Pleurotus djamor]|nr:hypothetical protein ONZ45_g10916 [Pleurotus djamor]